MGALPELGPYLLGSYPNANAYIIYELHLKKYIYRVHICIYSTLNISYIHTHTYLICTPHHWLLFGILWDCIPTCGCWNSLVRTTNVSRTAPLNSLLKLDVALKITVSSGKSDEQIIFTYPQVGFCSQQGLITRGFPIIIHRWFHKHRQSNSWDSAGK